jgi:DNA-nicking Smr family endonuclease
MAKKDGAGFNTPFERLARLPKAAAPAPAGSSAPKSPPRDAARAGAGTSPTKPAMKSAMKPPMKPAAPKAPAAPPAPTSAQIKARAAVDPDDQRVFEQAMRGTTPLAAADRGKRAAADPERAPAPTRAPARTGPRRNDDADAEAELADLLSAGDGLTATGGRAPDVDRRLLRRLRQGDYPIEAELDLHGRTRVEAEQQLERFVALSQSQGRRCVRVIHGRGLNSGDEGPVVRDAVQRTLAGGRVARAILAFTFATPAEGGDGATLVLLRKKKGTSEKHG